MTTETNGARKPRILYYTLGDDAEFARDYLRRRGCEDQVEMTCVKQERWTRPTREELRGFDAVVAELMPVPPEAVDDFAEAGVRLVATMSIGVDHMDVAGLAARGIRVTNCPGYCSEEVATHALALMLDLERKVTLLARDTARGGWQHALGYPVHRISGQTLGLVFFGGIARRVVPVAQALGMRVMAWAPTKSAEELAAAGVQKADSLDDLLRSSDVVSLHCPLLPETEGLIGARELSIMRPGALLVNTARGECIDENALIDALDEYARSGGQRGLAAAALDTMAHEAHDREERLLAHPRCIVTPHSAWDSRESFDRLREMALEGALELLVDGREPSTCVNVG